MGKSKVSFFAASDPVFELGMFDSDGSTASELFEVKSSDDANVLGALTALYRAHRTFGGVSHILIVDKSNRLWDYNVVRGDDEVDVA